MRFTHIHTPTGRKCAIVSTTNWAAVINLGEDVSNPFPRVHLSDLSPLPETTVEHLVYLTNARGDAASVAALRVAGSKEAALRVANSHGFKNFRIIERADSEHGYSDQCVHVQREAPKTA